MLKGRHLTGFHALVQPSLPSGRDRSHRPWSLHIPLSFISSSTLSVQLVLGVSLNFYNLMDGIIQCSLSLFWLSFIQHNDFFIKSLYKSLCFNISKNHMFIPTGLPDWATGKLPSEQDLEGYLLPSFSTG